MGGATLCEVLAAAPVRNGTGRVSKGRRIAFLADMKELGGEAAAMHAALAQHPALASIDTVHCIGPMMAHLHRALPDAQRGQWADTSAEIACDVRHKLDSGDVVLAKGSLSMKVATVVDAIRKMGHARPDTVLAAAE